MKNIKLKNSRLETLLSSIIDPFYSDSIKNLSEKHGERKDNLIEKYHPTSDEYLFEAFKLKLQDYGFPRSCKGTNSTEFMLMNSKDKNIIKITKILRMLKAHLGTQREALSMYYPENGYIGWHHNGNAPGYNILISYSTDGDGGFSYWNYKTESIETIKDNVGWNVKVGYYPDEIKEPNRVYWHMAKTKNPRISIAWVLNHKNMWKNMIDEITGGDYDHDEVLRQ